MELVIRPEPTDPERRAVEAALAGELVTRPGPYASTWRLEGIADNDDDRLDVTTARRH